MKKYILLFICVILLSGCVLSFAGTSAVTYHPYPIIFVHGIDPGDWGSFKGARDSLNTYFYDPYTNQYKYFHASQDDYFPKCEYPNNGDIPASARTTLLHSIVTARLAYPPDVPMEQRKVIIVAHSMGGLVVRSFLKQYPLFKDKIDKVIFIGTPHRGAPGASAVWIMNKIRQEILNPMLKDYEAFYAQHVGSRRVFADESSTRIVAGLINDKLSAAIKTLKKDIDWDLGKFSAFGPDPNGIALEQLRLDGDVTYHKLFEEGYLNKKQSISIDASITGSNTFLGKAGTYLSNPNKYFSMVGVYNQGHANITAWEIRKLRDKYEPDFTFPTLNGQEQSISNAATDGDGIVTSQSQMGIGGPVITIAAHHINEAEHWNTILAAIDDPPQIERVYAVPCDWTGALSYGYYIIIKVKEYLLADLEIESMDLDGEAVDLREFEHDGHYKPYVKFGKKFLTERNSDSCIKDSFGNNITLSPGEFYVRVNFPSEPGYGSIPAVDHHTLNIKLKNPAGKTKDAHISIYRPAVSFAVSPTLIDIKPYYGGDSTMPYTANINVDGQEAQAIVGVCEYDDYAPFIIIRKGNVPINCRWSGEGNSGDQKSYKIKLSVFPQDIYARPAKGDNKMYLPIFKWEVVRADPTFIQTHRSYSQFAKFDTLRRFEQYGYSLNPAYLNEADKAARQGIDDAISNIVHIEESFNIEKEKITAKARSLAQNQPSDLLEDKALTGLMARLANDKEICVRAIMENVNNSVSAAFARKASSAHPAPCARAE